MRAQFGLLQCYRYVASHATEASELLADLVDLAQALTRIYLLSYAILILYL